MTTGAGSPTTSVGVAVSPEEIATDLVDTWTARFDRGTFHPSDERMLVASVATALRAAEARGREEAAQIVDAARQKHGTLVIAKDVASAIRSLNAPAPPAEDAWQPTHRHYKGGLYRVVGWARHTETEEALTVYEAHPIQPFTSVWWARPTEMFHDTLPDGRLRFEPIRSLNAPQSPKSDE